MKKRPGNEAGKSPFGSDISGGKGDKNLSRE